MMQSYKIFEGSPSAVIVAAAATRDMRRCTLTFARPRWPSVAAARIDFTSVIRRGLTAEAEAAAGIEL